MPSRLLAAILFGGRLGLRIASYRQSIGSMRTSWASGSQHLFGGKVVKCVQSDIKTDDQLELILHDTADWAVVGQGGQFLCFAASLGRALDRAADLAADGAVVTAVSRLPFDNIVVCSDQMRRLRKVIAGREVAPIKYSDEWADIDDDLMTQPTSP
jgi:hypothetical protein